MTTKRLAALALCGILPATLAGQGVSVGASRWLSSPHVSEYRVGFDGFSFGPLSYRPTIQYLQQGGTSDALWIGAGADGLVRTTADARPYLLVGGALGLGRSLSGGGLGPGVGLWGGVGAELLTLGDVGLQAEALYTWRSRMGVQSVALGLRIGGRIGRRVAPEEEIPMVRPAELPKPAASDEATIRSLSSLSVKPAHAGTPAAGVVVTALGAMGTPYQWGGSGPDGFDCSGLIQYAYAQHGMTLPRRSVDQALVGREVGKELSGLMPGDILTFGDGTTITHVGLYLGDGRFIHSATGGVQTSRLSADDATGKWWFARWQGARRIIE